MVKKKADNSSILLKVTLVLALISIVLSILGFISDRSGNIAGEAFKSFTGLEKTKGFTGLERGTGTWSYDVNGALVLTDSKGNTLLEGKLIQDRYGNDQILIK